MIWRGYCALMTVLAVWSAYLQLNDPDPERWTAMYLACAVVAAASALGRPLPRAALLVCGIAFLWALFIFPELWGKWHTGDLMAKMIPERPEIEFGREFFGLLIVAGFCLSAFLRERRKLSPPPV